VFVVNVRGCFFSSDHISKSWKVGYNQVIGPPPRQGLITNIWAYNELYVVIYT
jgi:hypothetical protein